MGQSGTQICIVVELTPELDKKSFGQIIFNSWAMVNGGELRTDGRTIPIEADRIIQPAVGFAGVKQDNFLDFFEWFNDTHLSPLGYEQRIDRFNQVYLSELSPPDQPVREEDLRKPVQRNIENFLEEDALNVEIEEWLTEPVIEVRERGHDEAPVEAHGRPDLVGIANVS